MDNKEIMMGDGQREELVIIYYYRIHNINNYLYLCLYSHY